MRLPIIDTTRTITVVPAEAYHGVAPGTLQGYVIVVRCPVDGLYDVPGVWGSREEANEVINSLF